jgi:hypothetical protein
VPDPSVQLGLVPPHPQQLRRGETRQCTVPRQLDEPRQPDSLLDLRALGGGALVVPEDRRAQQTVLGVEDDEPVHLTGQSNRPLGQLTQHVFRGEPPVLGLLLRPARLRPRERVSRARRAEQAPLFVDRDALDRGGADVEADERH